LTRGRGGRGAAGSGSTSEVRVEAGALELCAPREEE
jgi:hypothetical protein